MSKFDYAQDRPGAAAMGGPGQPGGSGPPGRFDSEPGAGPPSRGVGHGGDDIHGDVEISDLTLACCESTHSVRKTVYGILHG